MAARTFQAVFGVWLLGMFLMTIMGWRSPDSILSEAGARWSEVNLRPDMMGAIAIIYGVGAAAFLTNRFVALGAAIQAPLAVNMAMYHAFVNQVLVPGGLVAIAYCTCVIAMLWIHRNVFRSLFELRSSNR